MRRALILPAASMGSQRESLAKIAYKKARLTLSKFRALLNLCVGQLQIMLSHEVLLVLFLGILGKFWKLLVIPAKEAVILVSVSDK